MTFQQCSRLQANCVRIVRTLLVVSSLLLCLTNGRIVTTKLNEFSAATVYSSNKAEIVRSISLSDVLPANEFHTVSIEGFTRNVQDESVRVKGTTDTDIMDLKLVTSVVPKEKTAEYKSKMSALTSTLNSLRTQHQQTSLESQKYQMRLDAAKSFVASSFSMTADKGSGTKHTVLEATEIMDFQEKETQKCHEALVAVQTKLTTLDAEITEVNQQIADLTASARQGPYSSVTEKVLTFRLKVSREVNKQHPLPFDITYMSTTAAWSPQYDIRVVADTVDNAKTDPSKPAPAAVSVPSVYHMEIDYFANVWQSTGEHWVDAKLTLSTSSPGPIARHPEPQRKGVRIQQPQAPHSMYFQEANNRHHIMTKAARHSPSVGNILLTSGSTDMESYRGGGISLSSGAAGGGDIQQDWSADVAMAGAAAAESMVSSHSVSLGDIGASHMFEVQYPVNVSSTDLLNQDIMTMTAKPSGGGGGMGSSVTGYQHLILIETIKVEGVAMFTYAVPSMDQTPYLMGWAPYKAPAAAPNTVLSPLLQSYEARVQIQGDNIGTVSFDAVQPGEKIRLNLGTDKHIHITSAAVLPTHKGKEEDKSTWFVTDKKKFRVRTEERVTTVRSSHTSEEVLVILSENLPRSTEVDDITVELLSPAPKDLLSISTAAAATVTAGDTGSAAKQQSSTGSSNIDGSNPTGNGNSNNDYLAAILDKHKTPTKGTAVYYCKTSGNLYWAVWVKPGDTVSVPYKYKTVWPEDKPIEVL